MKMFPANSRPDNVLINRYTTKEGILHHTDGPRYVEQVAIISLGADTIISFRRNLKSNQIGIEFGGDVFSVILKARSVLFFAKEIYSEYVHGIEAGIDEQIVGGYGECLNEHLVGLKEGDIIMRGVRTSITLRKIIDDQRTH